MSIFQQHLENRFRLQLQDKWLKYFKNVQKSGEIYKPVNTTESALTRFNHTIDEMNTALNAFENMINNADSERQKRESVKREYEKLNRQFEAAKKRGALKQDMSLDSLLRQHPKLYRYIKSNVRLDEDDMRLKEIEEVLNSNVSEREKQLALQLYRQTAELRPSDIDNLSLLTSTEANEKIKKIRDEFLGIIERYRLFTGSDIPGELHDELMNIADELIIIEKNIADENFLGNLNAIEEQIRKFNSSVLNDMKRTSQRRSRSQSQAKKSPSLSLRSPSRISLLENDEENEEDEEVNADENSPEIDVNVGVETATSKRFPEVTFVVDNDNNENTRAYATSTSKSSPQVNAAVDNNFNNENTHASATSTSTSKSPEYDVDELKDEINGIIKMFASNSNLSRSSNMLKFYNDWYNAAMPNYQQQVKYLTQIRNAAKDDTIRSRTEGPRSNKRTEAAEKSIALAKELKTLASQAKAKNRKTNRNPKVSGKKENSAVSKNFLKEDIDLTVLTPNNIEDEDDNEEEQTASGRKASFKKLNYKKSSLPRGINYMKLTR